MTTFADAAVEAVGWRLRKRGGPAEPLLKALKHRDPVTQFLAAEGLGRGGRDEGLSAAAGGRRFARGPGAAASVPSTPWANWAIPAPSICC